jgi:hypothetical protein
MRPPKADLEDMWDKQKRGILPPNPSRNNTDVSVRQALEMGVALVESAYAHVSHGGPTREDAEKWLFLAKGALAKKEA